MVTRWISVALVLLSASLAAAKEPTGVRLSWSPPKPGVDRFAVISWGETEKRAKELLGGTLMVCGEPNQKGSEACIISSEESGWYADFGSRRLEVALLFNRDRFYEYVVTFDAPMDYQFVKRATISGLGAWRTQGPSSVQNAFGATFQRTTTIWTVGEVEAALYSVGEDMSHGTLTVTYLPVSREIKDPAGIPPF